MRHFTDLFNNLDETNKTNNKVAAIVKYLQESEPENAIWGVSFLIGRKPKQIIPVKKLVEWSLELANIPPWLFNDCYEAVGDLAETITLLMPRIESTLKISLKEIVEDVLLKLKVKPEAEQKKIVSSLWMKMDNSERFVFNKLLTGGFRVGVSQSLVVKALAQFTGLPEPVMSHRLMGNWETSKEFFLSLTEHDHSSSDLSKPYPFCLAYPIEGQPEDLGDISEWQLEWKFDGIRSQMIKRNDEVFIWSRGEELINDKFPELCEAAYLLPNETVIDGEILPFINSPLPFSELQKRIGRKNVTKKILADIPVVLIAYDLLEYDGKDIRELSLLERGQLLNSIVLSLNDKRIILSASHKLNSWDEARIIRENSRSFFVEGLMLKRITSVYKAGRKKGDWWKWKIDPLSIDAVLIYAQQGHGRRAGLFTDYTFGVWNNGELVPFAKAYSGLTDYEIREVDAFVKRNTLEKFGPVRVVKPELVFEIGFEGMQISTRHKSGIAVRFPRILKWRTDKKIQDADSLENLKSLLEKND